MAAQQEDLGTTTSRSAGPPQDDLDWLISPEAQSVEADTTVPGAGRVDFVAGAALVGVNLIVSAGLVVVFALHSAGLVYDAFVEFVPSSAITPFGFAVAVVGALLGLAVGVGGFALSAWKHWPSYFWPLFGIAIALAAALLAARGSL